MESNSRIELWSRVLRVLPSLASLPICDRRLVESRHDLPVAAAIEALPHWNRAASTDKSNGRFAKPGSAEVKQ
jgi:hypothetical protein